MDQRKVRSLKISRVWGSSTRSRPLVIDLRRGVKMTDGRNETRERERESQETLLFSSPPFIYSPARRHARRSNEPASLLNATQVVSRPREKQVRGGQIDSRMTVTSPSTIVPSLLPRNHSLYLSRGYVSRKKFGGRLYRR